MHIIRTDPIQEELVLLKNYKDQLDELQKKLEIQTQIVAQMLDERGKRTHLYGGYRYTLVRAERTVINEAALKKAIGARAFNKLTVAKVDQKKVKEALVDGTLDPIVLEQHAQIVPNKASIRVSADIDE